MNHKHPAKDLQGLFTLGREQGYLTFDQVNDFLPQDVSSPGGLRAVLQSFERMNIEVLEEVPTEAIEEAEAEVKEKPEEESVDDFSESDPVRLFLKEMGKFQLLTREGEVEVATRIEVGEKEVEDVNTRSKVHQRAEAKIHQLEGGAGLMVLLLAGGARGGSPPRSCENLIS